MLGETTVSPLILIVDTQQSTRTSLRQRLEPLGYRIAEADQAAACLVVYERCQPGLVILSACLPDTDGFALCQQLHTHPHHQAAMLLILENADQTTIEQALQSGADDYITTPIHLTLLERRVRGLLSPKSSFKTTQEMLVALLESELRYKTLFDTAPISIFSKDRAGR